MNPKPTFQALCLLSSVFAATAAAAEVTVQLSKVHICCNSCVKGVDKAIATVDGATAKSDKDADTVSITAPNRATAQKAVDALVAAGYFGVSDNPRIKVSAETGASDQKVQSLAVNDVHLCCKACVTAVTEALEKVPGLKGNTAAKDAKTFTVTGDFKPTDVFKALHEAGLTGKAGKGQ